VLRSQIQRIGRNRRRARPDRQQLRMIALAAGPRALISAHASAAHTAGPLLVLRPCDYIVITMKARLVRIGNSRGVRLPKAVIDQVGLHEDIELHVENDRVVITAARPPRTGWEDAARRLAAEGSGLLDAPSPTRFDEDEWRW